MCDEHVEQRPGWQGWPRFPAPPPARPAGPWLDLSHRVDEQIPHVPVFGPARVERFRSQPEFPYNATRFEMVVHTGTHVDAPFHFISDGPTFEQIPPEHLAGQGVVWHFDKPDQGLIDVADLAAASPALQRGDIVAIHTGWADRYLGTERYDCHPSLTREAAQWLVTQGAKLLAVDFGTPDIANAYRGQDFDWPVHHVLLPNGVLICEHLTGHGALIGERVEFVFGALNISRSDGAPARVFARRMVVD